MLLVHRLMESHRTRVWLTASRDVYSISLEQFVEADHPMQMT